MDVSDRGERSHAAKNHGWVKPIIIDLLFGAVRVLAMKPKPYKSLNVTLDTAVHDGVTKKAKALYGPRKRSHHVNKVLKDFGT